jgi:protein-S-isoprenylcysteine O-methyltransferase Ste14
VIALKLAVPAGIAWAVLALAAGRADEVAFALWVGVTWLSCTVVNLALARYQPALLAERINPPNDRDRTTRRMVLVPVLACLVLSGLDVRFGWSHVPNSIALGGLVLVALGYGLIGWVLLSNPFASSAVRVQSERAHEVVAAGPYAFVRHPMYLAVVWVCVGSGPALHSWVGGLALLPVLALFVRRTLLEDRMLRRELPGYASYAARVRWRVVPLLF